MDETTKRALTARVLHSKLADLDPPQAVRHAMRAWLANLEDDVRNNHVVGYAEDVAVSDSAEIDLINVRGPKQ